MLYCPLNFLGLTSISFRLNISITKKNSRGYFPDFPQPSSTTHPEPIIRNYQLPSISPISPSNFFIFDISIFLYALLPSFFVFLPSLVETPFTYFLFL